MDGLNEFGFPAHEARHFDNDGWYEAETVIDHAAAAFDQHSKDNPTPNPGERVVVRYTRPQEEPLTALPANTKPNNQGYKASESNKHGETA